MVDLNMSAKQDSALKIIDKFVGVKKFTETEKQISSGEVRKIRRATDGKIAVLSVAGWFANNRRKIQQKFKNGEIAELPGQMEALEERSQMKKMQDPTKNLRVGADGLLHLDHLSTVGYPIFPGQSPLARLKMEDSDKK
ncbi:unnamed protein product [Caenorhabditis brenneri]